MRKKTRVVAKSTSGAKTVLADAVDEASNRLAKAEALLGCMAFGLLYSDYQEDFDAGDFATLAEMTRSLVATVRDNLDSLTMSAGRP
jgi:hypothetical protein